MEFINLIDKRLFRWVTIELSKWDKNRTLAPILRKAFIPVNDKNLRTYSSFLTFLNQLTHTYESSVTRHV